MCSISLLLKYFFRVSSYESDGDDISDRLSTSLRMWYGVSPRVIGSKASDSPIIWNCQCISYGYCKWTFNQSSSDFHSFTLIIVDRKRLIRSGSPEWPRYLKKFIQSLSVAYELGMHTNKTCNLSIIINSTNELIIHCITHHHQEPDSTSNQQTEPRISHHITSNHKNHIS